MNYKSIAPFVPLFIKFRVNKKVLSLSKQGIGLANQTNYLICDITSSTKLSSCFSIPSPTS